MEHPAQFCRGGWRRIPTAGNAATVRDPALGTNRLAEGFGGPPGQDAGRSCSVTDRYGRWATNGALVIVRNGLLLCWLSRTRQQLTTFSDLHVDDTELLQSFSAALGGLATPGHPLLLTTIDGEEASQSALVPALNAAGFRTSAKGLLHRGPRLD